MPDAFDESVGLMIVIAQARKQFTRKTPQETVKIHLKVGMGLALGG